MSVPAVTEISGQLSRSGSVTLDATGAGVITFDPDNARQRWVVDQVVVSTNQAPSSTPVPIATVYVNDVSSPGNSQGSTWAGSRDTFTGTTEIGPCDFLAVHFTGGIPGVTATAVLSGTKYTRRT